ncbi:hypothetical protein B5F98_00125 [Pseudoflavonifractor sp. An44]|uniref:hypothetical protein n=1 Tax=Pseudoflavonifractor sp. An44 TaxID=1965635 RepID=UPI000B37AAFC|nr:hypothetical protein [Pseudoflavonifractor sp. An44]OUN99624.1 hypothetical protein B5F98_00125 [Pseudoflavonifractor sp. An44]
MSECPIFAYPIRIIPFDLGRSLSANDLTLIEKRFQPRFGKLEFTPRQSSILKGISLLFNIQENISAYLYSNGICVIVVKETKLSFQNNFENFSISYGENRKNAHRAFFEWKHSASPVIWDVITELRRIVRKNTPIKITLRKSASEQFEHRGLSYIMTLSMFDVSRTIINSTRFKNYPHWLKSNVYALLDPSVLYLEDSSKFECAAGSRLDLPTILSELEMNEAPTDYERHRHINTFMSWASVSILGQLQDVDKEEYTALEVQLQSDWFYVYCLDKSLDDFSTLTKKDIIDIQRQHYELDLLENRLFDFDDSSMPTRILDIQKGLVETSGLAGNIQHLQRKMQYILERERLDSELRQKHLSQSTEILLFVIAFIEIAPTVIKYGNNIYPNAGVAASFFIILFGIILLIRKN